MSRCCAAWSNSMSRWSAAAERIDSRAKTLTKPRPAGAARSALRPRHVQPRRMPPTLLDAHRDLQRQALAARRLPQRQRRSPAVLPRQTLHRLDRRDQRLDLFRRALDRCVLYTPPTTYLQLVAAWVEGMAYDADHCVGCCGQDRGPAKRTGALGLLASSTTWWRIGRSPKAASSAYASERGSS